ncbi:MULTISPECIES: response regulator transcription factor [Dietzia]|uniref:response regulator transcription factor n=1 Tax=Dietzia TaxID=37914 RepID=UPI000A04DB13|nr:MULTISPECIES: response regulator transcription factor [Dietzia]MCT1710679.1 response regulator transcription factor [Dietzia cinnamea]MCT1883830.1 response regulator transcription factor [Dietzia cinnamea]MCT2057071.1 response regulator transcription factor [Dietzia cinnamea]MCT2097985.1 response regulator transcription factor [Dietzia cinnamea]MCT2120838.1 response regulator transcription factor [Dietzia cinnamea]
MTRVRVLIADDHAVVRTGLRALLASDPTIEVIADVADAGAAVERCRIGDVDVVLMDLRFSGDATAGVRATARIRELADPPQVLVLTSHDTDSDILGAIEAGACGYLLKDAGPDELLGAVRAAAAGESALSPTVAGKLMGRLRDPRPLLTDRETEVLRAVADGATNRQAAASLNVSEATVKTHLVHIFDKLGVTTRTAAVARARELGAV